MSVQITIDNKLIEAVANIPLTLRNGPLGRCLNAFGKPIATAQSNVARSSRQSGSRKKWSKKYSNNPAFQNDSKKSFGVKVLKSGVGVIVGATFPKGNKQQFVSPSRRGDTYDQFLWGKPGQTITTTSRKGTQYTYIRGVSRSGKQSGPRVKNPRTAIYPRNQQAPVKGFNNAKSSASSAFLDQLNKEIKELRLG